MLACFQCLARRAVLETFLSRENSTEPGRRACGAAIISFNFPIFNFTSPMGVLSRRTNGNMCDSDVYTLPLYAFLPVEHVKPSFLRASGAASPKSIQRAVLAPFPRTSPSCRYGPRSLAKPLSTAYYSVCRSWQTLRLLDGQILSHSSSGGSGRGGGA